MGSIFPNQDAALSEELTGCRLVMDTQRKEIGRNPSLARRQPRAHLMGSPAAQESAMLILSARCKHTVFPEAPKLPKMLYAFDAVALGTDVELVEERLVARRTTTESRHCHRGCVVTGDGLLWPYFLGAFFCMRICKIDDDPHL